MGKKRSAYDLMIAATAAATSRILLTTGAKTEFDQLAGVRSEVIRIP
jgi:tRNA(fMet)-specific endonuclease VapC